MTPIYGLTEAGVKKTGRDPRVLPRRVIYDPELTLTLPVGLSVTSGFNAIAHAAEGLYARDGNPILALMAEEGIRALARGAAAHPRRRRATDGARRRAVRRVAVRRRARPCRAWGCTTSCATRSAAASTCRMPRCTRSCCRMRSPTTRRRAPRPWSASRARSARARCRSQACATLARPLRRAHVAARDRHAGRRPRPRRGPRRHGALSEPAPLDSGALRALLQRAFDGAAAVAVNPRSPRRGDTHERTIAAT